MKQIRISTMISIVSVAMTLCMFVMCVVYAQKTLNLGAGITVTYTAPEVVDGTFTENLEGTFYVNGVINKYYDMVNGCSDTPVTNTLSDSASLASFNVGTFDFSNMDLTPKTYEFRFKITDISLLKLDNIYYQTFNFTLSNSSQNLIRYKGADYVKGPNWDSTLTQTNMTYLSVDYDDWEYYGQGANVISNAVYNAASAHSSVSSFAAFESFVLNTYFAAKITYTNAASSLSSQSGTITDGETAEAKVLIEYTGAKFVDLSATALSFNLNIVKDVVRIE